jgi:hypothetical protein
MPLIRGDERSDRGTFPDRVPERSGVGTRAAFAAPSARFGLEGANGLARVGGEEGALMLGVSGLSASLRRRAWWGRNGFGVGGVRGGGEEFGGVFRAAASSASSGARRASQWARTLRRIV